MYSKIKEAIKKQKRINKLSNQQDKLPICNICKKPISNAWDTYERYTYKTISGRIKVVWCCFSCQLNIP